MEKYYYMTLRYLVVIFVFVLHVACGNCSDSGRGRKPVYVKASVDYKGNYRKGHIRMPISTKKDAMKIQNCSRYYYQTRGKYRRKKNRKFHKILRSIRNIIK